MQEISNEEEQKFEEEWVVVLQSKGEYRLSKMQATILKQAISDNKRQVMFETFLIPIPYIVEFYRDKRFLKDTLKLPERASEPPFEPMSRKKFEVFMKQVYQKLGRKHETK
jgi:hypothetical protein